MLGVDAAWLVAHDRDSLLPEHQAAIEALLARRLRGEPMAYILGEREFYGRRFRVTPDTLIPRPETEHLLEAALARLPPDTAAAVLDVGTGSGCLAISLKLERPLLRVDAVDISAAALAVARDNGKRLGADVNWWASDLFTALEGAAFDLILANLPYVAAGDAHLDHGDVRFEPRAALAAGADGLDAIRTVIARAPEHLLPAGWLLLEHGWDQANAIARLLGEAGFVEVSMHADLAGMPRVSGGRMPPAPRRAGHEPGQRPTS